MGFASHRNNTIIVYLSFIVSFMYILLLVESKSKDLLVSVSIAVGTTGRPKERSIVSADTAAYDCDAA